MAIDHDLQAKIEDLTSKGFDFVIDALFFGKPALERVMLEKGNTYYVGLRDLLIEIATGKHESISILKRKRETLFGEPKAGEELGMYLFVQTAASEQQRTSIELLAVAGREDDAAYGVVWNAALGEYKTPGLSHSAINELARGSNYSNRSDFLKRKSEDVSD